MASRIIGTHGATFSSRLFSSSTTACAAQNGWFGRETEVKSRLASHASASTSRAWTGSARSQEEAVTERICCIVSRKYCRSSSEDPRTAAKTASQPARVFCILAGSTGTQLRQDQAPVWPGSQSYHSSSQSQAVPQQAEGPEEHHSPAPLLASVLDKSLRDHFPLGLHPQARLLVPSANFADVHGYLICFPTCCLARNSWNINVWCTAVSQIPCFSSGEPEPAGGLALRFAEAPARPSGQHRWRPAAAAKPCLATPGRGVAAAGTGETPKEEKIVQIPLG